MSIQHSPRLIFLGNVWPKKLLKQIGIQSLVLPRGNKMLDFRELLTMWAYY